MAKRPGNRRQQSLREQSSSGDKRSGGLRRLPRDVLITILLIQGICLGFYSAGWWNFGNDVLDNILSSGAIFITLTGIIILLLEPLDED